MLILTDTAYALPILFQYCIFIIEKMAPKAVCSCPPVIIQDCHPYRGRRPLAIDTGRNAESLNGVWAPGSPVSSSLCLLNAPCGGAVLMGRLTAPTTSR